MEAIENKGNNISTTFVTQKAEATRVVQEGSSGETAPILKRESDLMTATFTTQIELDERGVAWIADTKVKVTEVVLDKLAMGWSPEEIHFQHSDLSLAQIYAAFTYYYENQATLDEQIKSGLAESAGLRVVVSDGEFRRKLAALKQSY